MIADLKGLGLRQFYMPAVWMFRSLVEVAEQNYPCVRSPTAVPAPRSLLTRRLRSEPFCADTARETLGQVLVINTPSI